MIEAYDIKQYLAAIAFVSDVEIEAKNLKSIAPSLNNIIEYQFNARIRLEDYTYVYEDSGIEPQEKINKELFKKCHIFIGVIGKTLKNEAGEASNFQDEFAIIAERNQNGGSIPIYIYRKKIDISKLSDLEKEDYKQIDTFFKKYPETKIYYYPFSSGKDLSDRVFERLFVYLSEITKKKITALVKPGEYKASEVEAPSDNKEIPGAKKKSHQIITLLSDLNRKRNELDSLRNLNEFEKIRLHLLFSSLYYDSSIIEIMGNHENQLLYKHRKEVDLIAFEGRFIFRSLMADKYGHKTGWYWFGKKLDKDVVLTFSSYLAKNDTHEDVRCGALAFLNKFWERRLHKELLSFGKEEEKKVVLSLLSIYGNRGDKRYLSLIDAYFSSLDDQIIKAAWSAKFKILTRENSEEALSFLVDSKTNRGDFSSVLPQLLKSYPLEKLKLLSNEEIDIIRYESSKELLVRGKMSDADLESFLRNQDFELKMLAFTELIKRGKKYNLSEINTAFNESESSPALAALLDIRHDKRIEEVKSLILDSSPSEHVEKQIAWLSRDGRLAYFSFYRRGYTELKNQIHDDLNNGFNRLEKEYYEKYMMMIKEKSPSGESLKAVEKELKMHLKDLNEYIKDKFALSALQILFETQDNKALYYARKYIYTKNSDLKEICVEIIGKHGNAKDIPFLIEIAQNSYGQLKIKSARYALNFWNLDRGSNVPQCFIAANDPDLLKECYLNALARKSREFIDVAIRLMKNDNESIRLFSLSYICHLLKNNTLDSLLDRYISSSGYYYDVVSWLDKCLFSQNKFSKSYKKELKAKLI